MLIGLSPGIGSGNGSVEIGARSEDGGGIAARGSDYFQTYEAAEAPGGIRAHIDRCRGRVYHTQSHYLVIAEKKLARHDAMPGLLLVGHSFRPLFRCPPHKLLSIGYMQLIGQTGQNSPLVGHKLEQCGRCHRIRERVTRTYMRADVPSCPSCRLTL